MSGRWSDARYAEWRKMIPYSDDDVAEALKMMAEGAEAEGNHFLRDRYLSWLERGERHKTFPPFVLKAVLPYLIKTCDICGAQALYRQGVEGRCRTHKDITTAGVRARRERFEDRSRVIEEVERKRKITDHLRAFHLSMKKRGQR